MDCIILLLSNPRPNLYSRRTRRITAACVFEIKSGNGEIFFSFSSSVQISHNLLFARGHSSLLSQWSPLQTGGDCVSWCSAALVGQRPERPRDQGTQEEQGCKMGGAREIPARTEPRPGGPRVCRLAPGRTKGPLAGTRKNDNSSSSNHST